MRSLRARIASTLAAGVLVTACTSAPTPSTSTSTSPLPTVATSLSPVRTPTTTPTPVASATPSQARLGKWTATGDMGTRRALATAIVLADGRVLVAGGVRTVEPVEPVATAELYDPATRT